MRFLARSLLGLFLLGITAGLLGLAANSTITAIKDRQNQEVRRPQARERVYSANVVVGTPTTVAPVISTFGEIRSGRTMEVRATAGGTVVQLSPNFVEGGVVASGETLVVFDPQDAQSAVDLARSDKNDSIVELRDAQRNLAIAKEERATAEDQVDLHSRTLERQLQLKDRGLSTETAVEAAELALSSARKALLSNKKAVAQQETRVEQAQSLVARRDIALQEALRRLEDTRLEAEFSGSLSDVSVVEGGLVSMNERIARLVDPGSLEVTFEVSKDQYSRLVDESGKLVPARVTVEVASLSAPALVVRESATVDEGQTGRRLFARLTDSPSSGFRPGDFASVTIHEEAMNNVLVLPAASLDEEENVLVVGSEGRLSEMKARVVRRQGDDVLIRGRGLADAMIVVSRTPVLGSGIRVKPILPNGEALEEEPRDIQLSDSERQALIAMVEGNSRMPEAAKKRILAALSRPSVPRDLVERLRSRAGG